MQKETKQIIVIRKDLRCRKGKEISQGGHAVLSFVGRQICGKSPVRHEENGNMVFEIVISSSQKYWFDNSYKKICLQVESEEELLDIQKKAEEAGIECHLVVDSGLTEFDGIPTKTCLALGPDEAEKIDKITGHLKLY